MSFFDWLKKPAVHALPVAPPPRGVPQRNILGTPLRKGMWVVGRTGVGILTDIAAERDADGIPFGVVHLVDKEGRTIPQGINDEGKLQYAVLEPLFGLRQAKFDEIPEPRRSHMEPKHGAAMGYHQ